MNDALKIENNDIMNKFQKTENILNDVQNIIEVSQKEAYRAVNTILSQRNWLIGYRIAEEELAGEDRAEYGVEIIKKLSKELTDKYGKGYDRSNLYHCVRFYKAFPEIVDTLCRQSNIRLSWSHYRTLLQVHDKTANPKRVFTYEMLMDLVWNEDYTYYSRKAVNNHVSNLRKKLKVAHGLPDYVKSVYGIGYKFEI